MIRLKVGEVGVVKSSEFATFNDVDIPMPGLEAFRAGDSVRIDGFDGTQPRLASSNVRATTICPNCGHQFH